MPSAAVPPRAHSNAIVVFLLRAHSCVLCVLFPTCCACSFFSSAAAEQCRLPPALWCFTAETLLISMLQESLNPRFFSVLFCLAGIVSDPGNGILVLLSTMVLRWATLLFLTSYLDEFSCLQNGFSKLSIASRPDRNHQTLKNLSTQPQEFQASIEIDITYILREAQPRPFYLYVP